MNQSYQAKSPSPSELMPTLPPVARIASERFRATGGNVGIKVSLVANTFPPVASPDWKPAPPPFHVVFSF